MEKSTLGQEEGESFRGSHGPGKGGAPKVKGRLKLDKKDLMMLYELDFNARMPLGELAKRIGLSTQLTKYRLERMVRAGVIIRTMGVVDLHRLGFFTYRLYIRFQRTTDAEEKAIAEYFVKHPWSMWVVSTSGRWDMEVMFSARNPVHVSSFLKGAKAAFGRNIKGWSVSPAMAVHHFERTYLTGGGRKTRNPEFGAEPPVEALDALDVRILKCLSLDARMANQEIAGRLGVSFNTVKNRIAGLEKRGVIQAYRIFIDLAKIGRTYYKALITTGRYGEEDEKGLLTFCAFEPAVVYLVECFGEWDMELEVEVADEEEFRGIMSRLRNTFPETLQDYEMLHVYKEHKMSYFPMADELLGAGGRGGPGREGAPAGPHENDHERP